MPATSAPQNAPEYLDFPSQPAWPTSGALSGNVSAVEKRDRDFAIRWKSLELKPVRDWLNGTIYVHKTVNLQFIHTGAGLVVETDAVDSFEYRHGLHVSGSLVAELGQDIMTILPVIQECESPWSNYSSEYTLQNRVFDIIPHSRSRTKSGGSGGVAPGEVVEHLNIDHAVTLKSDSVGKQWMVGYVLWYPYVPGSTNPSEGVYLHGNIACRLSTGSPAYIRSAYNRP